MKSPGQATELIPRGPEDQHFQTACSHDHTECTDHIAPLGFTQQWETSKGNITPCAYIAYQDLKNIFFQIHADTHAIQHFSVPSSWLDGRLNESPIPLLPCRHGPALGFCLDDWQTDKLYFPVFSDDKHWHLQQHTCAEDWGKRAKAGGQINTRRVKSHANNGLILTERQLAKSEKNAGQRGSQATCLAWLRGTSTCLVCHGQGNALSCPTWDCGQQVWQSPRLSATHPGSDMAVSVLHPHSSSV